MAFGIGLATLAAMLVQELPLVSLARKALTGIDSFPLMAMPFFLLAAELMTGGSLSEVLLRSPRSWSVIGAGAFGTSDSVPLACKRTHAFGERGTDTLHDAAPVARRRLPE